MGNDNACATCLYYVYDDEYEEYLCDMDMDEDEYVRLISDSHYRCPYYRNGDEYKVVRKLKIFSLPHTKSLILKIPYAIIRTTGNDKKLTIWSKPDKSAF